MTPTPEQLARSIVDQWDTGIDELERIIAAALAAAFERGEEEALSRLLAWLRSVNRKPPELAFTAGQLRLVADTFLMELSKAVERGREEEREAWKELALQQTLHRARETTEGATDDTD